MTSPQPHRLAFFRTASCAAVVVAALSQGSPSRAQTPRAPRVAASPPPRLRRAPEGKFPVAGEAVRLEVIALLNARRAKYGLPPLVADALLMQTAQAHAGDMNRNGYFDHADRQGGQAWDRAQAIGYPRASLGENIAMGQRTPEQVMNEWMRSDGHRANILGRDFRAVGVGVVGFHWVQVFGSVVVRDATVAAGRVVAASSPRPSFNTSISPVSPLTTFADFEKNGYDIWELTGNCWGRGPEDAGFAGGVISGWSGLRFATTAHARPSGGGDASSGTGRALSAPFVVPADAAAIRFKIAGGRYPGRCCLNLVVDGKTVRTDTGGSPYAFQDAEWDVSALRGKTARLEIVDAVATGAHAYIHVDDIAIVRQTAPPSGTRRGAEP